MRIASSAAVPTTVLSWEPVAGNTIVPVGIVGSGAVVAVVAAVVVGVTRVVVAAVVVEVVGVAEVQVPLVMVLVSSVTAPLRASSRPVTDAPVAAVIDVNANTVPTNTEFVPSVAELVTCQNTLHGFAPLTNATVLDDAVMSVLAV